MKSQKTEERVEPPAPYRCIKPQCPSDCSMCNHAIPTNDAALVLIADLLDGLAVDGFDGPLEDGESALVDRARKFLAEARRAPSVEVAEPIYVECCQCDNCLHIGINDCPGDKAACNSCGWSGAAPQEDRCPGCGETGTMARACPECGSHYMLLAEGHLAAGFPHDPARTP